MADPTTPVQTVKKPVNFIVGLALGAVTVFVLAFAIAKGLKKGKN